MGRIGETLSHLDEMWSAGVRIFSDDGSSVDDAGLLRLAMEYVAERGGVIAQHAEDRGLSRGGHMHEGSVSSRLGIRGLPSAAEEIVVARDFALARLTGVRYHVQHVSSAGTIPLVRAAKADGLRITAEVTPHHLVFNHEHVLSLDPAYKMYPPLRASTDVDSLRAALIEGAIDAVATDHAPHSAFETEVTFEEAPRGVIGLETSAAAVNTAVGLPAEDFFDRLSIRPAEIAGLERHGQPVSEGGPANLMMFDPNSSWTPRLFASKSQNTPFIGFELRGRVLATIFEGLITHDTRLAVTHR
jgi:dihydroorotase